MKHKIWLLFLLGLLAGCGDSDITVTPLHVECATNLCTANGGYRSITNAKYALEVETVGRFGARNTGYAFLSANVKCVDGTTFSFMKRIAVEGNSQ